LSGIRERAIGLAFATALVLAVVGLPPLAQARTLCTAIADARSGKVLLAQGGCEKRVTPASTFKIAISLMGFDSGVLTDAHAPALPYRESYAAWRPEWRRTTDPADWMAKSVVWYSQQITTSLGETRFRAYVHAFRYGNEDVSGGLTRAWLGSSLQISPLEQIDFLSRMLRGDLPVSPHALEMTERITALPESADGWSVHGKTGSGAPYAADGAYDRAHEYGWFVGWAKRGSRTITFANLIQNDGVAEEPAGLRARRELLAALPSLLRSELVR
jgi:beta-lactamase class D